jgi:hypothetical protein
MLDRAHCCTESRVRYIQLLDGACLRHLTTSNRPRGAVSDVLNFITWLQKMNLGTETFIFPASWKTDSWATDQETMLVCMKRMARSVTSVTFQHGWKKEVCNTVLEEIATRFTNLVSIDLHEMGRSKYDRAAFNRGLCIIAQQCDLQKIVVTETAITDTTLTSTVKNCTNLMHINVRNRSSLSDASILTMVQSCPKLLYLDVGDTNVELGTVSFIAQYCPLLQHLNLCSTRASARGCAALEQRCPDLTYLGCKTTERDVLALATSRPNLQALITPFTQACDGGLTALVEGCPLLRELDLSYCTNITSEGLVSVAEHSSELRMLRLMGFAEPSYPGLYKILQRCAKLDELHLVDCYYVQDDFSVTIAEYGKNLQVLDTAESLSFGVEGVRRVGKSCKKLREVTSFLSCRYRMHHQPQG